MESRAKPQLSRKGIASAAVRIADEDGLGAVTMRKVASALGVEAMSLYHHVAGKSALADAMLEFVFDEVVTASSRGVPESGWKHRIRHRCLSARTTMVRHTWAPGLLATGGKAPLNMLRQYDAVLGELIAGGLSYRHGHQALHALGGMIIGLASDPFGASTNTEAAQMTEAEQAEMASACPHLTAMVQEELHKQDDPTLGWCDSQAEFEFTLNLLLDGLERET